MARAWWDAWWDATCLHLLASASSPRQLEGEAGEAHGRSEAGKPVTPHSEILGQLDFGAFKIICLHRPATHEVLIVQFEELLPHRFSVIICIKMVIEIENNSTAYIMTHFMIINFVELLLL